jgi:hypothetical protein
LNPLLTDAKPKPKSTTPLRRSAPNSLPIRANPTPTLGSIQTIFTLATAEQYLLPHLRSHANLPAGSQALHESWWTSKWGNEGKEGEVFVSDVSSNGSIVCRGFMIETLTNLKNKSKRRSGSKENEEVPVGSYQNTPWYVISY